ncbi:putative protein OS=Streptomyces fumanus OX=67302 GN=GCM10018772_70660 PE=4 SV=1 [Streptomyces fumanus]|uniref:Uncharacterized protein n=1 Tax=Streptomyces fumanus TaxID=67302 RepID=A0A919EBQ7_9ACTN|nr:hypothetical protein [Streptomyces fumanus]GHF34981.1 hypothetical protein GCM10018772_70660 [Streptomyces fumanus]
MKITIEGASEEFERKLLDLLAEHRHELAVTADTEWTVERAERYLRSLPAGARRFAEMVVVDGDGYADADTLRSVLGKLNGPTVALSRAIPRGVREGWWPEGTRAPITVVYDPENPSWQKAKGYEMTSENVPVFRSAIARMAIAKGAAEAMGITPGGPGKTTTRVRIVADPGVNLVDADGGSLPHDDEDEDDGVMECHVCLQPYEVDEEGTASHLDTSRDANHTPRS